MTPFIDKTMFPEFYVRNVEELHNITGFSSGGRSGGDIGNVMGIVFSGGSMGAWGFFCAGG